MGNIQLQFKEKRTIDTWGIAGVFLMGVLLHFYLGDFVKTIYVYGDELGYYSLARSFFKGKGLIIRSVATDFQKIGYPLILAPLFSIGNPILRIGMINMLNSIVMMLSIIPAWLIGKEIGLDKRSRYGLIILTAIWPDMMASITFMSEVLYWPFFLLFVYVWFINEQKRSYRIAIIEGFLCYLGYLTKEIFLALLFACIAFEITWPILSHSFYQKKRVAICAVFVITFTFCHIAMKMMLFSGVNSSYNHTLIDIQVFFSCYKVMYLFYAFFYYLAAILTAVLIVPFVYPVAHFKSLNQGGRKLFCYIILFFLITSATISYMISVREDLGKIVPHLHMRYFGPAFVVLLSIFLGCIQNLTSEMIQKKRRLAIEFIALTAVFVCFVFKGGYGSAVDHSLTWQSALSGSNLARRIGLLLSIDGGEKVFYLGALIANALIIMLVVLFHYIYTHKRKDFVIKFCIALFAAVCIINCGAVYSLLMYRIYRADDATLKEVLSINNYFKNHEDANVLYLTEGIVKKDLNGARYMDTYMETVEHLYYVRDTFLTERNAGDNIRITNTKFHEELSGRIYEDVNTIDYIILENSIDLGEKQLANVERVDEISGAHYTVYKNLDPAVIRLR